MQYEPSTPITLQPNARKMNLEYHLFEVSSLISLWLDMSLIASLEVFLPKHTYDKSLVSNLILLSSKLRLTLVLQKLQNSSLVLFIFYLLVSRFKQKYICLSLLNKSYSSKKSSQ